MRFLIVSDVYTTTIDFCGDFYPSDLLNFPVGSRAFLVDSIIFLMQTVMCFAINRI